MDVPGTLVAATVTAYWLGAGAMIVRVRRHARRHEQRAAQVVPVQGLERFMALVWVPLVLAWIALPWLALQRAGPLPSLPALVDDAPYAALRWAAAVVALACLAGTIKCWTRMGNNWRMAVTHEPGQVLITDGPFSRIRHPIYAFSILLMISTMVALPTPAMLVVGLAHIALMAVKARNEERHLLATYGSAYESYAARTGRFLPRF
ncbi:MAG: isoprenylcysteine carboxylmethyltransferase family protein [Burkholderiales bacterium]|nr:isoprenylcysteine carboxylmethyltransferase family protein [Burkholderiales bacterium]